MVLVGGQWSGGPIVLGANTSLTIPGAGRVFHCLTCHVCESL